MVGLVFGCIFSVEADEFSASVEVACCGVSRLASEPLTEARSPSVFRQELSSRTAQIEAMKYACQHHKSSGAPGFVRAGATKQYPPDMRVEPIHMHLELRFDLEANELKGTNTITVRGNGGSGHTLRLNAVSFVRAEARGEGVEWFRYDGKELLVHWSAPLADGEERTIEVPFMVKEPVAGLMFSKPSEAYPEAAWFAATDSETELARHWMPCVDFPHVRPTLSFSICADERFTALANGAFVGEEAHEDGTKTVRWALDHPCPSYLTCIAVGDFIEVKDGEFDGIPIAYYATREFDEDHVRRGLGRTREALEWMTAKLGVPFPFPKYYQFALPGFGGAMENISLVSWDDSCLLDEGLASELTWLIDQVNVHEMAHSYFGDLVVCRDFAHAWLKESWATYMEACWYEDKLGPDEFAYELYQDAGTYFREANKRYQRPIVTREFNSSWQMYDMHLYPGGACRLHTLRCLLGDEVFWRGVTLYLQRYARKTVETDHFRQTMEEVSGRSLVQFFDQWFYSKGYPRLKVIYSYDPVPASAHFTVEQEQWDTTNEIPLF
jgi:aminopeptidase N